MSTGIAQNIWRISQTLNFNGERSDIPYIKPWKRIEF